MTGAEPRRAEAPLTLAVISSSCSPLVLLDGDLGVVAASRSFCDAFKLDYPGVCGRAFGALGAGEWSEPHLDGLLRATAGGDGAVADYEMNLERAGAPARRLVINAERLAYGADVEVRLLLAILDVTDARNAEQRKDDVIREKTVLLQEVQHRVANSLQIIAAVLLQNARKVQSEETRSHLHDAHHRVMSVAAVQRQLAATTLGEVALRPYLNDLCKSIDASMIHDHEQLTLLVRADEGAVGSETSVSLGLIVTELVINALKHAFPGRRQGRILVDYKGDCDGLDWVLAVSDDGVGMPAERSAKISGLGASIVDALAKQLGAVVTVEDADPGARISVRRTRGERVQGRAF